MQRLARHRTPMLAIILAVLVAISSTLVMLITMGQQEETPVLKEANLQEDDQVIASTDVKGKAYFGLGILNPIEHRIIAITNNNKDNNANTTFITAAANSITNNNKDNNANTTFITAAANSITNNNKDNKNNNNANANNLDTHKGKEKKNNNEASVDTNPNIIVNSKNNPTAIASCGQLITRDVILSKDIECPGIGMIVGADGITINLNNHKLSLVNNTDTSRIPEVEEIGILVPDQKNITIGGPGIITGFNDRPILLSVNLRSNA
jgi:hypothetical protein